MRPGKYMWLERAYDDEEEQDSDGKGKGKASDGPREKTPEPTLGTELLVSLAGLKLPGRNICYSKGSCQLDLLCESASSCPI